MGSSSQPLTVANPGQYCVTALALVVTLARSPPNEELAQALIDASATGQLSRLKIPTPQYLLQTAAKNGQGRCHPSSIQLGSPGFLPHWTAVEPLSPNGVTLDSIPKQWKIYEDGVTYSALEGNDPIKVFHVPLEFGMTPKYTFDRAGSPFADAVIRNNADLAVFFLSRGAKVNGCYGDQTDSHLGTAACRPSPDMLKPLIEYGAKYEGNQALRQAVQFGQLTNAEILLGLRAAVNGMYEQRDHYLEKDERGSPLHFAVKRGPLSFRRQSSKPEAVRCLLAHGADPDVKDGDGKTPFDIAVQDHAEDIMQVFREHGVDK